MDDIARLNRALDYIEDHLAGDIDEGDLARILAFPPGLFQRMFAVLTGISLAEHVRRRRLTLAAFELQCSRERILDLALKYGYESADAFSVAFRRQHGVSPSVARTREVVLKSYPRLHFQMSIQGGTEMEYQMVEKPAFLAVGRTIETSQAHNRIPAFWQEFNQDGSCDRVMAHMDSKHTGGAMLGICFDSRPDGSFRYMAGVEAKAPAEDPGLEALEIPASTWLVFESIGPMPGAIQEVWRRIFSEFLPGSLYRHSGTPDMEVYYPGDPEASDYRCEVWIPVVRA